MDGGKRRQSYTAAGVADMKVHESLCSCSFFFFSFVHTLLGLACYLNAFSRSPRLSLIASKNTNGTTDA